MSEFRRIFINKSTVFVLFLLTLICSVMFLISNNSIDTEIVSQVDDIQAYKGAYEKEYKNLLQKYEAAPQNEYASLIESLEGDIAYNEVKHELVKSMNNSQASFAFACDYYMESQPELVELAKAGKLTESPDEVLAKKNALVSINEQVKYVIEYSNYYDEVQENAREMQGFSIFVQSDSFAIDNVKKTAADFQSIENARATLGDNRSVTALFSDSLFDYAILLFIGFVCVELLKERKNGLFDIVHATKNGRTNLALKRVAILFVAACLSVAVLFGVKVLFSWRLYDGTLYQNRLIQSIPDFKTLCSPITITAYITKIAIVKVLCVFCIALCIWLILSAVNNINLALCLTGVFLIFQYGLFTTIRDNSILVMARYLNVFSLIQPNSFLSKYLNLNVFGVPVALSTLIYVVTAVLMIAFGVGCVAVNANKRLQGKTSLIELWFDRLKRRLYRITGNANLFFKELYKVLFVQRGIFVVIVLVIVCLNFGDLPIKKMNEDEKYSKEYYNKYSGEATEEKLLAMQTERQETEESLLEAEAAMWGLTEKNDEYYMALSRIDDLQRKVSGLSFIINDTESIIAHNEKTGDKAIIMWQGAYDSYLQESAMPFHDMQSLKAMLFVVLLCGGIACYEREQNMIMLIRATAKGRAKQGAIKTLTVLLIVFVVFACIYLPEFVGELRGTYMGRLNNFSAPIASLKMFRDSTANMSLGLLIGIMYCVRFALLFLLGIIAMLVGSLVKKVTNAQVFTVAVLVMPACLLVLGVSMAAYLSVARLTSFIGFLS